MGLLKYTFAVDDIQPPALFYVRPGDRLLITSRCNLASVILFIHGTMIGPDGRIHEISERQETASDLSLTSNRYPIGEGMLTHLTITTTQTALLRGQCFITAQLVRGLAGEATSYASLISSYVTYDTPATYPPSRIQFSTEGPGNFQTVIQAAPTLPPDEVTYTVPANTRLRLLSMVITVITPAGGGNRYIQIAVVRASSTTYQYITRTAQAGGLTFIIVFSPTMATEALSPVNNVLNCPIFDFPLTSADTITVSQIGGAGGVEMGGPRYNFERWITG